MLRNVFQNYSKWMIIVWKRFIFHVWTSKKTKKIDIVSQFYCYSVDNNKITNQGILSIIESLTKNTNLTFIDLRGFYFNFFF